jgi:hypothetical protein
MLLDYLNVIATDATGNILITGTTQCLKSKAVLLHAMVALGGRDGIAPTHS